MDLVTAITAFFLAGSALILEEVARRFLQRKLARSELARDGLHEMLSMITSLERLLPEAAAVTNVKSAEQLAETSSSFLLASPVIPHDKYIDCFDDEEVHRLVILVYERHQLLRDASAAIQEAFTWLLEHPDGWETPRGREAQNVRTRGHEQVLDYIRDLLRYASELCWRLFQVGPAPFRARSIEAFIKKHYDITPKQLREQAAYYRRSDLILPWNREMKLVPRAIEIAGDPEARGFICHTYDDDGVQIVGPLGEEIALPHRRPDMIAVCRRGTDEWTGLAVADAEVFDPESESFVLKLGPQEEHEKLPAGDSRQRALPRMGESAVIEAKAVVREKDSS